MGETCSEFLAGAGLFIFNGVDLVAGVALCAYSLYIGTNHYAPAWLYVPLLAIGSVLAVASLMSGCGLAFRSCSSQGGTIDKFLRDHSSELKLSDDQLTQFERHKFYPAYALLVLCLMEALRQRYSTTLHHARLRRQYQYEMLA
ncbi:hypothetical protein PF005_g15891 [Phytophthora fragariae]|uniref:Transmembrane protein n=1 Tax=Phytophthora fragariae TaxID=53985 RepID=A0A6A4CAC5_9STRA|nr:hypothetical protein PF009_g14297 [Phytophthora fragariae]KAE8973448.1 hypothetical protein PF011_g25252 [Phytophthora fragariae]KAE9074818.1 hypothetical protein PF010_g24533 [Phytophthora fragariae]KAE9089812.1 hypothetical protein PF006_g25280 [Phytophthora fragariae]KAE9106253.1 hypothetical protein PF007_g13475 [Phytophthora fragariae]